VHVNTVLFLVTGKVGLRGIKCLARIFHGV
jgi:hypothetical protein